MHRACTPPTARDWASDRANSVPDAAATDAVQRGVLGHQSSPPTKTLTFDRRSHPIRTGWRVKRSALEGIADRFTQLDYLEAEHLMEPARLLQVDPVQGGGARRSV